MSVLKKCRNLLFGALLFFSTKTFAQEAEENIEKVLSELEDSEDLENPSYASTIYFTLPIRFGFNHPLKNNETVEDDKVDNAFLGSNTFLSLSSLTFLSEDISSQQLDQSLNLLLFVGTGKESWQI